MSELPAPASAIQGPVARGRGTGRRGYYRSSARHTQGQEQGQNHTGENARGEGRNQTDRPPPRFKKQQRKKKPITHFLCIPIGHHLPLRTRMVEFQNNILSSCPLATTGVEASLCMQPRRLHMTLGTMSCSAEPLDSSFSPLAETSEDRQKRLAEGVLYPSDMVAFLQELRPKIMEIMSGEPLFVPLERMDVMDPPGSDLEDSYVMWLGPDLKTPSSQATKLKTVMDFLHRSFKEAGYLEDFRPLKLHVTCMNSIYRRGPRRPFSYSKILDALDLKEAALPATTAITSPSGTGSTSRGKPSEGQEISSTGVTSDLERRLGTMSLSASTSSTPAASDKGRGKLHKPVRNAVPVDLGMWRVDEIQVCKLGSWGPEGEYVSVGAISLRG